MSVHRFTRAGLFGLAAILPAAALGGHTAHAAGSPGYAKTSGSATGSRPALVAFVRKMSPNRGAITARKP